MVDGYILYNGKNMKTAIFGILCTLNETQTSYLFSINDVTASIRSSGVHWAGDMLAEMALMRQLLYSGKIGGFSESWHELEPFCVLKPFQLQFQVHFV